jgi:ribosomal protein S12 methylthiotransferase
VNEHSILLISLGCDKNLVDSEKMLGALARRGFRFTDDEDEADIVIVNTCCFIHDAKEESILTMLELAKKKDSGQVRFLIVVGCLAQRYESEIQKEIPQVDAVLGTLSDETILQVLDRLIETAPDEDDPAKPVKRHLSTAGHFAYLKIAEGCDKYCTYCIIPSIRGSYKSTPIEELVDEAKDLCAQGVQELILVAQETTRYGIDLYGRKRLPELLRALAEIESLRWIRLLYCYPEEITDELIDLIAQEPKICRYLDIPIQHASDIVLKNMGRRTTKAQLRKRIKDMRRKLPGLCLRTTLISGFPQETDDDHQELLDFVREMHFERLGVFEYSKEEGTPAAKMHGQIPARVKKKRRKELMKLQQELAFEKAGTMIGRTLLVLIEGKATEEEDVYVGRTYMDAPDVDGLFFLQSPEVYQTGQWVEAVVTGFHGYDLIGEVAR